VKLWIKHLFAWQIRERFQVAVSQVRSTKMIPLVNGLGQLVQEKVMKSLEMKEGIRW